MIIVPKWRMVADSKYELVNDDEINKVIYVEQKKTPYFSYLLPFSKTVLAAFRKLTIEYNSPSIELTTQEVFSLCVGIKYYSSLNIERTIDATPNYFRRVEQTLNKYCIKNGNKYKLQSNTDLEGCIVDDYRF